MLAVSTLSDPRVGSESEVAWSGVLWFWTKELGILRIP